MVVAASHVFLIFWDIAIFNIIQFIYSIYYEKRSEPIKTLCKKNHLCLIGQKYLQPSTTVILNIIIVYYKILRMCILGYILKNVLFGYKFDYAWCIKH